MNNRSVHQKRVLICLIRSHNLFAYFLRGIYDSSFYFINIIFVTVPLCDKTPRCYQDVYPEAGNLATDNLRNRCTTQVRVQWEKKRRRRKKRCLVSFVCNNEAQIKRRVEGDTQIQRIVGPKGKTESSLELLQQTAS